MNEPDFEIPDVHAAGLAGLDMPAIAQQLTDAGLTLEKMKCFWILLSKVQGFRRQVIG